MCSSDLIARLLHECGDTGAAKVLLGDMVSDWEGLMKTKGLSGNEGWMDDVDAELQRLSDAVDRRNNG